MSGTFHPLKSDGLVKTGGARRSSWKESERADCSSEIAPGTRRITASAITTAGISPPERT
jgi:hypothetical protein